MSYILFEADGEKMRFEEATVAQVIGLMDYQFERQRAELIDDLEAADAPAELKLDEVKKLRDEKGLTSKLIRYAFTLRGAMEVIEYTVPEDKVKKALALDPDQLVWLALRLLGFNTNDVEEGAEDETENPTKDRATSSAKS